MPAALVIQQAKRMRRIILSFVAFLALQHYSTLPQERNDFRKKLLNINPLALEMDISRAAHHLCKILIFHEPQKRQRYEIHDILQRNKLRLFSKSQKNIMKYN